jgi:uncharacterized protein (DUF342 family)
MENPIVMKLNEPVTESLPSTVDPKEVGEPHSFKITPVGKNRWKVHTEFAPKEKQGEAIPARLHRIKAEIARRFDLSETQLRYAHLKKKEISDDGILFVEFEIERIPIPSGAPNLTLESIMSDTGNEYDNMICYIDLFPFDDSERPITLDSICQVLKQNEIAEKLTQWEVIEEHIRRILNCQIPMHHVEIARGEMPSKGKDAELAFAFPLHPEPGQTKEYVQARKVKRGKVLCTKTLPTLGDQSGMTVKGESLPPRTGWNIRLVADAGTRMSSDEISITAESDGLVTAHRQETALNLPEGRKILTAQISFRVDAMLVLSGKKTETLTTEDPIEVTGSLHSNSHLISRNEVHVQGDVQRGSQIQASGDITVGGDIQEGSLISNGSIVAEGETTGSTITANGEITMAGPVIDSQVQGSILELGEVSGSDIQALRRVTVSTIGTDKQGRVSQVNIGHKAFFKQRIEDSEQFIARATENLRRLCDLFGHDKLELLTPAEREKLLIKFLSAKKAEGHKPYKTNEVEALKQLLGSVATLKQVVQDKSDEIQTHQKQMDESDDLAKILIVKERITGKTIVTIGEYQTELEPTEYGVCVRSGESGISVENLPKDLESIEELLKGFEEKESTMVPQPTSTLPDADTPSLEPMERDLAQVIRESDSSDKSESS